MANRVKWPTLGIQPPNIIEHATQLIADATALQALDRAQRQKLPDQLFESFINSVKTYATKAREQPSSQQILDKLNQIHHLTKSSIAEDITLIKNAVNNTTQPSARVATWAEKVRSGGPPTHPPTPPTYVPTTVNSKEREIIVKLGSPEATALLRQKTPEQLRKKINDTLHQQAPNTSKPPQIVAVKQLKSGDISIHATNATEADLLKDSSDSWVRVLGTTARVLKPTYGVLVHGVRTAKENIDPSDQAKRKYRPKTRPSTRERRSATWMVDKVRSKEDGLLPGCGICDKSTGKQSNKGRSSFGRLSA
jgi:hypothetical protein